MKTSLGVSNVSFGIGLPARSVLNSVFLHHCVEAGLDLAMVNPNHITPYGEIPQAERDLADDLVFNRRDDALEIFIQHFEAKGPEAEAEAADPTAGMEPEEALHWHILRRKRDGVEAQIDACVEKIGAVPTLNDVLLPAMKEVGDKFGAGELILPFVLQSAEVMKRAVAQLEQYLDKLEGYTKGTVVLATVFGDVHDIGKSLVNTILTNNGYTVVDLGKQVPIRRSSTPPRSTRRRRSACPRCSSPPPSRCRSPSRSCTAGPRVPGAARRRRDQPQVRAARAVPRGQGRPTSSYDPGVFYCKDAFEGLSVMDRLIEPEQRAELVEEVRAAGDKLREIGEEEEVLDTTDDTVRSAVRTDVAVPEPPFWGVREIEVDREELYTHLDTHVLFKLHWGGRGVKGEEWRKLLEEDFRPRLERMWAERRLPAPARAARLLPVLLRGQRHRRARPGGPRDGPRALHLPAPAQGRPPVPGRLLPPEGLRRAGRRRRADRDRRRRGHRADGQAGGRRASSPSSCSSHGLGVQTAEGLAEWLHWRVRNDLGIDVRQGRRYSWGYPAVPDQSEHLKVERLLDLEQIGMEISDGYAPIPEQSTLALDLPPPAGRLLRHAQRPAAARRLARRRRPRHPARPLDVRRCGSCGVAPRS